MAKKERDESKVKGRGPTQGKPDTAEQTTARLKASRDRIARIEAELERIKREFRKKG